MKKTLLFLSAAALTISSLTAAKPVRAPFRVGESRVETIAREGVQARERRAPEADGFTIQFCDEIQSWYYMVQQNKVTYRCYIYITPEMATQIAGNKITEITFSSATDFTGNSETREGSVFVCENFDEAPATSTDCTVINSYNSPATGYCQTVALENPYTVKADTGFYFGYEVKSCRYSPRTGMNDYPVGVDYLDPNGFSGVVDIFKSDGSLLGSLDMAEDVGTNLFLAAKTVGEADGFVNLFMLGSVMVHPYFTLPVVNASDQVNVYLPVRNSGINTLESIEYTIKVNDGEATTVTAPLSIEPSTDDYVVVPAPKIGNGRNTISVNVLKLNDKEYGVTSSADCIATEGAGYDRQMVIEEGTGAWCGYCPRGIVGLDYITKNYPDNVIAIAVHNEDDLAVSNYQPFIDAYVDGFPYGIINRDPVFAIDPSADVLQLCYDIWKVEAAAAKVDLYVNYDDEADKLTATATTTFGFDEENAAYKLAFVILEDGLYEVQNNYYAGYPKELEWWGEQGSSVVWQYDHTARGIYDCFGIAGSVPATIVKGQANQYSYNLPMSAIEDLANTAVVALLFDEVTGTILNAAKVEAAHYGHAGVDNVINDNTNAPVEYFNLQGIRVESPASGSVVIRRQGNEASKVFVR